MINVMLFEYSLTYIFVKDFSVFVISSGDGYKVGDAFLQNITGH